MRRTTSWVALSVALVALAGCGGSGSDGNGGTSGYKGSSPEQVVLDRLQALAKGKLEADATELAFAREKLATGATDERSYAAWALGSAGTAEDVPVLIRVAHEDEEPTVRLNSIKALGQLGGEGVEPELVGFLGTDDGEVRLTALNALSDDRYAGAVAAVAQALKSAKKSAERRLAAEALIKMDTPEALPFLQEGMSDYHKDVRATIAYGLGDAGHPSSVPTLVKALGDGTWEVRANAAQALGKIGDPSVKSELETLLEDDEAEVRAAARKAIGQLS